MKTGNWTVGETATRLAWVTRGYTRWASGRGAPERGLDRLAETNARLINELPGRRPAALADLFAGSEAMPSAWRRRRPSPITARHARLAINGITSVLPLMVSPQTAGTVTVTYTIHVRGGSRFVVRFQGGALTVEPLSASPADCHISADPVALPLVSMGRVSPWRAVARGKLVAWGRKPWLGRKYRSLLTNL